MTTPVLMPKIGLTMTEGKIVEWKKKEGEWVEKEEVLFVFETEKVTIEVEAQQSGFLVKILVPVDEVAAVGTQVAILAETRDETVELTPGKEQFVPAPVEKRIPEVSTQSLKGLGQERKRPNCWSTFALWRRLSAMRLRSRASPTPSRR